MPTRVQPVILSGGAGTRLWPRSREAYPKQFLPLVGRRTLFQETVERIGGITDDTLEIQPPVVVCNELHRFLVAEQLNQIGYDQPEIVLEPVGRNTAPALTVAAIQAAERQGEGCVLVVMPADHYIADLTGFRNRIQQAVALAGAGLIVTLGIVPDRPETGYGYIRKGQAGYGDEAYELEAFVEKPDLEQATNYVASGDYFWNSGLFVLQAAVWLEELGKHRPEILEQAKTAVARAKRDGNFLRLDREAFAACPSDSIDYAVMEKLNGSRRAVVISMNVGWCDLGSWTALTEIHACDPDGNVVQGDVFVRDTKNSLLYSENRFLAALGVEDLLIVDTPDAILVAHKTKAQDIRAITDYLQETERSEHRFHRKVHRPWGSYEAIGLGPRYQVKRIEVKPGASLSLQMHHHRAEHWIVVRGTARVTRGKETFLLTENQSTYIPLGVTHRLENPGTIPLEIIEVQSGSYLGEDDIVRFEDRYHRTDS